MKREEFIHSIKNKKVSALIDLLRQGQSRKLQIDPDLLESVIEEINNRQLSEKEKTEFENFFEFSFEESSEIEDKKPKKSLFIEGQPNEFSKDEIDKLTRSSVINGRYATLKAITGLNSLLGYIVIIIGIGGLIFLADSGKILLGFFAIIASLIVALPLLAFSNLIDILINIEYNTRKKRNLK